MFFSWIRRKTQEAVTDGLREVAEALESREPGEELAAVRARILAACMPKALPSGQTIVEDEPKKPGRSR